TGPRQIDSLSAASRAERGVMDADFTRGSRPMSIGWQGPGAGARSTLPVGIMVTGALDRRSIPSSCAVVPKSAGGRKSHKGGHTVEHIFNERRPVAAAA